MEDLTNLETKETLKGIDIKIEELKEEQEIASALERLHENEDFKKIILDNYLDKEANRLFDILVTPSNLKREKVENIIDKLNSIRNLKEFFGSVLRTAATVETEIDDLQTFRKEVTKEASFVDAELVDGK